MSTIRICTMTLLALIVAGCTIPGLPGDNSAIATEVVQTYQAQMTSEASLRPTETLTSLPTLEPTITLTVTAIPSETPPPTLTPSATATPDPGWSGKWTMLLEMLSGEPFPVDVEQSGDRIISTISLKGEEYFVSGVVEGGGGRVSGAVYWHGVKEVYFIWEMQPGFNMFLGRWWKGVESGSWCGGRRGVPAPPISECFLRY